MLFYSIHYHTYHISNIIQVLQRSPVTSKRSAACTRIHLIYNIINFCLYFFDESLKKLRVRNYFLYVLGVDFA